MIKNCSEKVLLTKSPYNGGLNVASQGLFREGLVRPGACCLTVCFN